MTCGGEEEGCWRFICIHTTDMNALILIQPLTPNRAISHSFTHPLSHSPTHSLTHSPTHSLIHSFTHSFTHHLSRTSSNTITHLPPPSLITTHSLPTQAVSTTTQALTLTLIAKQSSLALVSVLSPPLANLSQQRHRWFVSGWDGI